MKKLTILFLSLVLSIALLGCQYGSNGGTQQAKEDVQPPISDSQGAQPAANEQTGEGQALEYQNSQYGFTFKLPASWQGYRVIAGEWEGRALGGAQEGKVTEKGALLSIRHPQWTEEKPRQDIPIMVFTLEQWEQLRQEKFSVGAAPILPKELGRNDKYVFALPARYNFAFPEGFEEVEEILKGNPLQAK